MSIKVNSLEIENVKRVKAVTLQPTESGLTIIGGDNGQGKTSVLDAIAWALGGNKNRPSKAERDGSMVPPKLKVTLNNGLIVERTGKNADLKVLDPSGNKQGQKLLDSFINELALNLPKFMNANNKEKADILLQIIGVGEELARLEMEESKIYNERHTIGQIADQKKKYALEQPFFADAPAEPISASELIKQQQDILARNGENNRKRQNLTFIQQNHQILLNQMAALQKSLAASAADLETAQKYACDLFDESTEELEQSIANIEKINAKVRSNMDKQKADMDAETYKDQYDAKSGELANVRNQKQSLLDSADLPLPGLTVENGVLLYNGQQWDNMAGSEQLIVATSIVRKLNPDCGFVLMDKLEQLDLKTINKFNDWLVQEGLQVIATRVSTGGECSIIIEDGYSIDPAPVQAPTWKAGTF